MKNPVSIPESFEDWQRTVTRKFEENHKRMANLELEVKKNNDNSQELLDILSSVKGGLKVLGGLGFIIKWTASIAIPLITIWALVTGKPIPK